MSVEKSARWGSQLMTQHVITRCSRLHHVCQPTLERPARVDALDAGSSQLATRSLSKNDSLTAAQLSSLGTEWQPLVATVR
jgi:hypothetical protein